MISITNKFPGQNTKRSKRAKMHNAYKIVQNIKKDKTNIFKSTNVKYYNKYNDFIEERSKYNLIYYLVYYFYLNQDYFS